MSEKIDLDVSRFKKIVRGKIKSDLKKFVTSGEMIGKQGDKLVSIPLPRIDIPHFCYGDNEQGGVGQGEGESGDPLDGDPQSPSKASDAEGQHILEVDVNLDELVEILAEELELPRIQPRSGEKLEGIKTLYRGIRRMGPESLRHTKRTFRQALIRQITSGEYNPDRPRIIPYKDDKRYKSGTPVTLPQSKAVIIYMMDVSGSMGNEQKEIVRLESYWIDAWLSRQYKGLETRFIVHDAIAREVDKESFFKTKESGGTIISSAYKLCREIIEADYPPEDWNIYTFHFSDGDNWSAADTLECQRLLEDYFFKICNLFCYGQVDSEYGSGQFLRDLNDKYKETSDVLITSQIASRDDILKSIKEFLGKGK